MRKGQADSMSPASWRRLTLLDVMVLIAATALGAQSIRVIWHFLNVSHFASPLDRSPFLGMLVRSPHALNAMEPIVAAWTFTLPVLWLVPPRRPLRRLILQPGLAACLAAALALVISSIYRIAETFVPLFSPGSSFSIDDKTMWSLSPVGWIERPMDIGIAVAVVWAWLILGGRWKPQPTWIDRMGRAVGFYWLLMIF